MMGENPNYWWSLNGKLMQPPPPPSHQPTNFLSTTPMPMPVSLPVPPSSSSILINPHHPYLFGSSLLVPSTTNSNNTLSDHHQQQENLDFPVSWSQLLMTGLTTNDQVEEENLGGGGHVGGEIKHGYLDNIHQQSRQQQQQQLYYDNHHGTNNNNKNDNNNEDDIQAAACSSSWSSHHQLNNPVPSVGSSSTMSLSTTASTMFDFSSKINSHQYSSQYDDTSTSGASKKPRFQSSNSSTQQPSPMCNDTFTSSGTSSSKRSRAGQSATQTPLKVRKEKLGDRISALHQLVSPFGKTDTASVLLEATAQIRFLESQIEALTSPYMNLANNNNVSGATRHQQHSADEKRDLASRGLCLVPVTCMDHIDTTNMTTNGAEFWTPALGGGL